MRYFEKQALSVTKQLGAAYNAVAKAVNNKRDMSKTVKQLTSMAGATPEVRPYLQHLTGKIGGVKPTPMMRLAARLRNMFGWSSKNSINTAKKIEKSLEPSFLEKHLSLGRMNSKNRTDILQNELKNSTVPAQRISRYFKGDGFPARYIG